MTDLVRVEENPEQTRYEIYVGDALAGIAEYRDTPGQRTMFHTETDPAFRGRGLASTLAAAALDDVRARGLALAPTCPFIRAFVEQHPEYADLVRQS